MIVNFYKMKYGNYRNCGIVIINNSTPRLICKDCIKYDDRQ